MLLHESTIRHGQWEFLSSRRQWDIEEVLSSKYRERKVRFELFFFHFVHLAVAIITGDMLYYFQFRDLEINP